MNTIDGDARHPPSAREPLGAVSRASRFTARGATSIPVIRIGAVEVLFEVRVAVSISIAILVCCMPRVEMVLLLPIVRHAVIVGIRWGDPAPVGRPAADVSL
jgi:hypothetical protein